MESPGGCRQVRVCSLQCLDWSPTASWAFTLQAPGGLRAPGPCSTAESSRPQAGGQPGGATRHLPPDPPAPARPPEPTLGPHLRGCRPRGEGWGAKGDEGAEPREAHRPRRRSAPGTAPAPAAAQTAPADGGCGAQPVCGRWSRSGFYGGRSSSSDDTLDAPPYIPPTVSSSPYGRPNKCPFSTPELAPSCGEPSGALRPEQVCCFRLALTSLSLQWGCSSGSRAPVVVEGIGVGSPPYLRGGTLH